MTIGKRIAKCRKEKNYSQEYIAELLDVSRQAVSKWETDQTEPDTGNLIKLAKVFNVSVEYLANGENQTEKIIFVEKKLPIFEIIGLIFFVIRWFSHGDWYFYSIVTINRSVCNNFRNIIDIFKKRWSDIVCMYS